MPNFPVPLDFDPPCAHVDAEWYFADSSGRSNDRMHVIMATCGVCPARRQCAEYAIEHEPTTHGSRGFGIWGGSWPGERQQIRQARLRGARASVVGQSDSTAEAGP